jgi:hypothetical protein
MNNSPRGLVVGTLLLFKILIRTPPFLLSLLPKKGDAEKRTDRARGDQATVQNGITFWSGWVINKVY